MRNSKLYELAVGFYETRLWELIDPDDLLGIDLNGVTGYVRMFSDTDKSFTLLIFPGPRGLSSHREAAAGLSLSGYRFLGLDVLQCTFLTTKGMRTPVRRELRRNYADLDVSFTDVFPVFHRQHPYVETENGLSEEDVRTMFLAFTILIKLSYVLRKGQKTKKDLEIRRIRTTIDADIAETEPGSDKFEAIPFDREIRIPVFRDTPKGFQLTTEALPHYAERAYHPPKPFAAPVYTTLLEHEKKGEYDADLVHLPQMSGGDPPYYPEVLVLIDREDPERAHVFPYPGPFIEDTDAFLADAVKMMLAEDVCPKLIRYRSEGVKTVLKPLCECVGIKTRKVQYLDTVDCFLDQFSRFIAEENDPSANGKKKDPENGKNAPRKRFSASEIAELEILPVFKIARLPVEELWNLLSARHSKLSAGLARKIYRALTYES